MDQRELKRLWTRLAKVIGPGRKISPGEQRRAYEQAMAMRGQEGWS